MPRRRTLASRLAAAATGGLAVLLVVQALTAGSGAVTVLQLVLAAGAVAGAVKTWLHNCFESHLAVSMVLVATTVGTALGLTVGIPGRPAADPSPVHALTLLLCLAVGVLLAADARIRRAHRSPALPPYAL